jgi:hypothetical protein
MFVLRSTYDRELAIAHRISQRACEVRDEIKEIGLGLVRDTEVWRRRALAAEGELAKRKAHAVSNLRQNRKTKKDFAAVIPLG